VIIRESYCQKFKYH